MVGPYSRNMFFTRKKKIKLHRRAALIDIEASLDVEIQWTMTLKSLFRRAPVNCPDNACGFEYQIIKSENCVFNGKCRRQLL